MNNQSEAETGTMTLVRAPVGATQCVDEAVSRYADEAEDREILLRSEVVDGLRVIGDHTRLRQVLANLIENAVKYTGRGGRVDVVSVLQQGSAFSVTLPAASQSARGGT